jgi:hypothetical protein
MQTDGNEWNEWHPSQVKDSNHQRATRVRFMLTVFGPGRKEGVLMGTHCIFPPPATRSF